MASSTSANSSGAPAVTTRTPVSTSCAYEAWNATSGCWIYRPCARCLQTPGCMISHLGFCQELALATSQHSYKRAIALNLTLPAAKDPMNESMRHVDQEWEFPAFEATYCAADDAVCRDCVAQEFWYRGFRRDSRFCVGTNGCVCVLNCEFPTWNSACGEAYVNDAPATTPGPPTIATPTPATNDQCRYYAVGNETWGCRTLRTCPDCLETPGCRIGIDGYCEADVASPSSARYSYTNAVSMRLTVSAAAKNDTNAAESLGIQEWQFPAAELAYCAANDTTCSQCVQKRYWLSAGAPSDSRFCVGADGCVCVSNCVWDASPLTRCPTQSAPPNSEMESSGEAIARALTWIAVVIVAVTIVLVCGLAYACHSCQKARRARREVVVPVARVVGSGWEVAADSPTRAPSVFVILPSSQSALSSTVSR